MKTSALRRRPSTTDVFYWSTSTTELFIAHGEFMRFLIILISLTWWTSTTELFYWSTSNSRKTQAKVDGRPRKLTVDAVDAVDAVDVRLD